MQTRQPKSICVVGLGYIGLPTASMFATHGFKVLGVDQNTSVVKTIQKGQIHIEEPGLATVVRAAVVSKQLTVASKPAAADVFIIAVPTPLVEKEGKRPQADMSFVESAVDSVLPHLKKGNLLILESTSPPGTIRDLIVPKIKKTKLKVGTDIGVAYCPERVIPGQALKELIGNDRVVGAISEKWGEMARKLYKSFVSAEVFLTDPTSAEMVKLLENSYRDVNIALANEVALLCEKQGVNVWEVIQMANRHPRVNVHKPGPGVGGHCISVDPWFLASSDPDQTKVIQMARSINNQMPSHVVQLIGQIIEDKDEAKVTLLGLAYKGNVDDTRESPALAVLKQLKETFPNLAVSVYDPHVKSQDVPTEGIEEAFRDSDLAVLLTPHNEFRFLDPSEVGPLMRNRVILDTHNALKSERWIPEGFEFYGMGIGTHLPKKRKGAF